MQLPRIVLPTIILLALGSNPGWAQDDIAMGEEIFSRIWIADIPGVENRFDGLGPHFTARSCLECHVDLREGRLLSPGQIAPSSLLVDPAGPVAKFGSHLHDRATIFEDPEVMIEGEVVREYFDEGIIPLDRINRRTAPSLRTTALIDAVLDQVILAAQDPDDSDQNGVFGLAHLDPNGTPGRFGWKAEHPTLKGQILAAFRLDMGLTEDEVEPEMVDQVAAFLLDQPDLDAPEPPASFAAFGCADCHVENDGLYSNLLLHDMGPQLADSFGSLSSFWRTAPLTDLGDAFVNASFLHDGRAHSVNEAVLLHGGEAASSSASWSSASPQERASIITWLKALAASFD